MNKTDFSKEQIQYGGSQNRPAEVVFLQVGPFSCLYESGNIRYIKAGGKELIRLIYPAVRDHNWGTIKPILSNERIEKSENRFMISYNCLYKENDIHFQASYCISGDENGNFIFTLEGEAKSTFRKNRIGFNVLHPPEIAGKKYRVRHTDGSEEYGRFPKTLSPHQPIMDIKNLDWEVGEAWMALEFSGDVFEMEDQRNWTDASFKTYSTPLSKPFPVTIEAGTTIHQEVKLKLENPGEQAAHNEEAIGITIGRKIHPLPSIGIGQSSEFATLHQHDVDLLKQLQFSHYRVDLKPGDVDLEGQWKQAVKASNQLNWPIELALHFGSEPDREIEKLKALCLLYVPTLKNVLVFSRNHKTTPETLIKKLLPALRTHFPGVPIGGGTDCFFTELNREPVNHSDLDFLSYSVNPQVHHFDNQSLVETLKAQAYTLESARSFAQGKPVHVSPITLKMRFNPNATGPEPQISPNELPTQVDTRQMSLFGAAWAMGSLKYLSQHDAASLTYFETIGSRGILQGSQEPLYPDIFKSKKEMLFPLYWVFKQLLEGDTVEIIDSESSQPLKLEVIAWESAGKQKIMVANFTPDQQQLGIHAWKQTFEMLPFNEGNFHSFVSDPAYLDKAIWKPVSNQISLEPYSLAMLK
jgi:hypothetical protein